MDYKEYLEVLIKCGLDITARGMKTKEILGLQIIPKADLYSTSSRSLVGNSKPAKYVLEELIWFMNGSLKSSDIEHASKFWNLIADKDGKINSNYGHIVIWRQLPHYTTEKTGLNAGITTGINWVLDELRMDSNSRKAIIMYNTPEYYYNQNKDFVCTISQQFFIRQEKLYTIVNIRSSDAIRGLSFDIPWWSFISKVIANSLKVEYGQMIINIGSGHIYQEHYPLVARMIGESWTYYNIKTDLDLIDIKCGMPWTLEKLNKRVKIAEVFD
jgi:thymidylate synthase